MGFRLYGYNASGTSGTGGLSGSSLSVNGTVQNVNNTPAAPTLTTSSPATNLTQTGATLAGNISSFGSPTGSSPAYGFVYSLTSANATPELNGTGTTTITTGTAATTGNYSSTLSSLTPNTNYSFQAYATNGTGTTYGGVVTFTTAAIGAPTVTTATPSSPTSTGATLGGSVTGSNGDVPTEYGVVYSTTNNLPTTADSKVIMSGGSTNFSQAVALAVGTYYIRAYASNSAGAGYGSVVTLTIYPTPTITALSPNPVAAGNSNTQTLTINGSGFISSSLTSVTYNGTSKTVTFVSPSQLTIQLTAANVATAGSFPVVVTNGTPGGGSTTATLVVTQVAPTVTTTAASSITSVSATSGGSVASAGGGTISARGVVYGTSPQPRLGGVGVVQVANASSGTNSFSSSLTGLTPATTYYVAAYATNSTDTSYGSDQTFKTLNAPTVVTTAVSPTTVAAGSNLTVTYTTTGTFGTGNTFTAELSSVTGTYPGTVLATVSSGTGTLTVTIPAATAIGAAYTIRLLASSPATVGAASGAFTIIGPPLVSYTTAGLRSLATSAPVFIVASNITATDITRGPGVTNPNTVPAGTFTGSQFSTNATLDPASDDYFAFAITVAAGSTAAITNVVLNAYRSNGGPDKADLLYSTDGATFAAANTLGSITLPTANTTFTFAPSSGALQNVSGTLYFRLYGYGINSSGSTGGLFYLADPNSNTKAVVVNGTTAVAPASLSASPASLAFTAISGQRAPTQTYTLTGLNLAANASVDVASSDASVLVSLTGGAPFAQSATATASASGALSQTVTVLYTAPATTGTTNVTIDNTSGGLSAPVAVAATATATAPAPTITSFSPSSGTAGTAVLISGTGFTGTTSVTFNGVAAATPSINSAGTQLTAVVPGGATTGPIAVTTPGGTATTPVNFVVIQASPAGQLLLEENFDYPASTALSQTASTGWLRQNTTTATPNITTTSGNLSRYSYPQGAALSVVNPVTSTQANLSGGSNAEDLYKVFAATQPSGTTTLYVSALVSLSAAQTGDYFLNFYNMATATNPINVGRVFAKAVTGGYQLGVSVNGNENVASYTPPMTYGNTYLVVLKYENTTGTDAASLFVFDNSTTALPITEPSTPTAGPVTSTIAVLANLDALVLRQGGTSSFPSVAIDNLRVASGWGSVIGQPVFTSSTATIGAGSYYSLRVAGSAAHATTSGTVAVEKTLDLDGGTIATTSANPLVLRYRAPSTPADDFQILIANGGTSYVDGPVSREVEAGVGLSQFFPIGRNGNYRPLTLNIDIAPNVATLYTAVQTEGQHADQTLNTPLTRISKARYFTLTPRPVPAAGTFSGNVELSFGSNEGVTDPSASTFVVAKNSNDGTHWTNIDRQSNTSSSLKSGSFQSFSSFLLASTDPVATANPLPVKLTSFAATRVVAGVQVAWATASEKNSDYFDVERSLDGRTFARVASMAAHGTTAQAHAYASLDGTAPVALLYYRLRQVDLDGTVAYSPVATVAATAGVTAEFILAPNPAREHISFLTAEPMAYTVRNTLGQPVRSGATTAGTNDLVVSELPAGVYFLELHGDAGRVVRKFVKE